MNDWTDVWTDTEVDPPALDLDSFQQQANRLQHGVVQRNRIEIAAGVFVVVGFSMGGVLAPTPGAALGPGLCALGGALVTAFIYLRGTLGPSNADPSADTAAYLNAHRDELRHQIKLMRWVPLWYLGPLVPGVIATVIYDFGLTATGAGYLGVVAVFFLGVTWANHLAANKLQTEHNALSALGFGDEI
ncbi:MAG: hypothetical protein GWP91_12350 [Rhodobacterales bacterium]|nr:hypothetical protein [Rhodobacterales bacterium]